jgi:hypothetical protein
LGVTRGGSPSAAIVQSWFAVLPLQPADEGDLFAALEAVRGHRLASWDAMLWASAQRAGLQHMQTEDFQDGFALGDVTFINPFNPENNQLSVSFFRRNLLIVATVGCSGRGANPLRQLPNFFSGAASAASPQHRRRSRR